MSAWDEAAQSLGTSQPAQPVDTWQQAALSLQGPSSQDTPTPTDPTGISRLWTVDKATPPAGPSNSQQIIDAGIGAAKAAGKVLGNIGDVATLGLTHLLPGSDKASAGINATGTALNPSNQDQRYGGYVADAATLELGNGIFESLAHLPLAERLVQAAKALKVAQEHPVLAGIAGNAIRSGAVTGATTLAVTGNPKEAAEGAAVGGAAGAASEAVPAAAKSLWQSATGQKIQQELQSGIRSVLGDVADEAGVDTAEGAVRDSAKNLADNVRAKSSGLFKQIDAATDGQLTNTQNKIRAIDLSLRGVTGTEEEGSALAEDTLMAKKATLESHLDDLFTQAQSKGVAADTVEAAKSSWKQASALSDLDAQIKLSTFGNAKQAAEVVDPKKLVSRLQKLDDSGRLLDALGPDKAQEMLDAAYDALKSSNTRGKVLAGAKIAGGIAGTGAVGGSVLKALGGQ